MEDVTVRWIYQYVKLANGKAVEAGQIPTLCFRGLKHMLCVSAGYPVRVLKRGVEAYDDARIRHVMDFVGNRATPQDALAQLLKIAKKNGISPNAKRLLDRVAAGNLSRVEDEDSYQDEEDQPMKTVDDVKDGTQEGATEGSTEAATNTTNGGSSKEGKTVKAKKAKGKSAAPAKGKSAAPAKGKPAGTSARNAKGDTPFRPGTMKEKAFLEFKAYKKTYDGLEKGKKKEWCDKIAKKLGASPSTVQSWVNGQFTRELSK